MKKSNFVAMILGTIGMVFFALGMCMALIEEWGMFHQGIVSGVIGLVILLITLIVWRRMEGKEPIKLSGKTVGTVVLAIFRSTSSWHRNEPVHGIWKDDSWSSDRTCRYRSIINADSTDKRTEIKQIPFS